MFQCSRRLRTCSHSGVLQDDSVVDEADVLAGFARLGAFLSEEVEDSRGEDGVFAILNKLAQVTQANLFRIGILLQDADDCVHDSALVIEPALNTRPTENINS